MYAIKKAVKSGVRTIFLDAEQESKHEKEGLAYGKAIQAFNQNEVICYKTYQMYRKNAMDELLRDMSQHPKLGVKLVRGAYYKQDYQTGALYKNKSCTDEYFDDAVRSVVSRIKSGSKHKLVVATHNNRSIEQALLLDPPKESVAFAQLLGMNDIAGLKIAHHNYKIYKYVPYGGFIETYPYLVRRLYENLGMLVHVR
jgi:proline dehydrogenase